MSIEKGTRHSEYWEDNKKILLYFLGLILLVILFGVIVEENKINYIKDVSIYGGPIFAIIGLVVVAFPSAKLTVYENGLEYTRFRRSIFILWKSVVAVHFNPAKNAKGFSSDFCIEYESGFTGRIDTTFLKNIPKTKDPGNDLVLEIKTRGKCKVLVGGYSEFKRANKFILVILLIIIISTFYFIAASS